VFERERDRRIQTLEEYLSAYRPLKDIGTHMNGVCERQKDVLRLLKNI